MTIFFEQPALLAGFKAGVTWALYQVYKRYFSAIWALTSNFAKALRQAAMEREDAVQEIFERAFLPRAREAYDGQRPYRSYLVTLARNQLIDIVRKHAKVNCVEFEEGQVSPDEAPSSLEEDLDLKRAMEAAQRWIAQQEPDVRSYITHRFVEMTSQREMSKFGKWSRRNARTLDSRVLEGLKAYLDAEGIDWRKLFR